MDHKQIGIACSFERVPDPLELGGTGQVERGNEEDSRSHLESLKKHLRDEAIAPTAWSEMTPGAAAAAAAAKDLASSPSNCCQATDAARTIAQRVPTNLIKLAN